MKSSFILLLSLTIVFGCKPKKTTDKHEWISLFNGNDLTGWTAKIAGYELGNNFGNTFRVKDGILSVRYDQYDSFRNKFGSLYYSRSFTNYRLRIEYRFVGDTVPGAPPWGYRDSGVQFHCQPPNTIGVTQNFPICLEYNLHGGNGVDERPVGEICANGTYVEIDGKRNGSYCTLPSVKRTFHGDQWVTLEIDINNGNISHFVNGEEILKYKNPRYDTANSISKTLVQNGDDSVSGGYISLQSNSHPIDFRSIEIMEYK